MSKKPVHSLFLMERTAGGSDITIHQIYATNHLEFFEIIAEFLEEAEPDDDVPIRVPEIDGAMLMVGLLLGSLRRNDSMSVLVYATYGLAKLAAMVFLDLVERCGGKALKIRNVTATCIAIQFRMHPTQRRCIVFGVPAIYEGRATGLFISTILIDPDRLIPEDSHPVAVMAVTHATKKARLPRADALMRIKIANLFDSR